jgi:hypothetical protein
MTETLGSGAANGLGMRLHRIPHPAFARNPFLPANEISERERTIRSFGPFAILSNHDLTGSTHGL